MNKTYQQVAKAITFFVEHQHDQPSLKDVAEHIQLSEFHLQKLFSKWVGVSPKQFLQYLTKENAKRLLSEKSVMDASYEAGLSSASRLHDLMLSCEGVTPGEYKTGGDGLEIQWGTHDCPFGSCFIAMTKKGVCKLAFMDDDSEVSVLLNELISDWPNASITKNQSVTYDLVQEIFNVSVDQEDAANTVSLSRPLKLLLKGTPFQLKVWEALLAIPQGQLWSYQDLADYMGKPSSVRAVSSAVARNNIAYLIPCHRVVRGTGAFNQYRWGKERKPAMIGWEMSRNAAFSSS